MSLLNQFLCCSIPSPHLSPGAALAQSASPTKLSTEKTFMVKRATVLLLVVLLASYAAPVSAQTLTEQEWSARFTAELNDYASTHSEAETRAYAQYRLDQLTSSNLIPETTQANLLEAGISPEVLYGETTSAIYLDLDYEFNLDSKLRDCT